MSLFDSHASEAAYAPAQEFVTPTDITDQHLELVIVDQEQAAVSTLASVDPEMATILTALGQEDGYELAIFEASKKVATIHTTETADAIAPVIDVIKTSKNELLGELEEEDLALSALAANITQRRKEIVKKRTEVIESVEEQIGLLLDNAEIADNHASKKARRESLIRILDLMIIELESETQKRKDSFYNDLDNIDDKNRFVDYAIYAKQTIEAARKTILNQIAIAEVQRAYSLQQEEQASSALTALAPDTDTLLLSLSEEKQQSQTMQNATQAASNKIRNAAGNVGVIERIKLSLGLKKVKA